ncbi:BlaI/MecI/CopY family transcriptional regulator [Aminipila terrae]|uniref:BlaI/MecI/CopY family transcriptional regulator n=1 Tax=Aminipila terrae TaxID=2697030 RepID=A0A6P1MHI4_9FIRM|nr:BlaI/MecI/CopY family transcriptional regulator [Aminipila terrae]QHI71046.1 BlaI/MecI/CopY family transcriptional regulator [Aminipila terrae]
MIQQISNSELELMKIIWKEGGKALYASIMSELKKEECEWKKNTVLTLLSRLVDKGFLTTSKIGRRNVYVALVSEEDYLTTQTKSFLEKVYEGNVRGLVSTLIQQDILSSDDLEELQTYWKEKLNE